MSSADDKTSSSADIPSEPECANCRYWKREAKDSDTGICRRYPPNIAHQEMYMEDSDGYADYPVWPLTLDDEWCGEHSLKDNSQQKDDSHE